jgi:hypothetical protein
MQNDPKDSEFLDYPIRFYTEMEVIFGHAMVTGRLAYFVCFFIWMAATNDLLR